MIRDKQFDDIFNEVQSTHNVQITSNARSLIVLSVRSIYQDPHETWIYRDPHEMWRSSYPYPREAWPTDFERIADNLVKTLPQYMDELSQRCREGGRSSVSYFDALHWIGEHLEPLCRRLGLGADK